ncbi:MAG: hypothetical protein KAT32_03555 [Candidatus Moranbacteria bacterium]|nr:hypothetical protein [Candidatus Moranbacteria bacterium]
MKDDSEQRKEDGCSENCFECDDPDCEGDIGGEMNIGIMVNKSNATGRGRVLPPTPYYKSKRRTE